MKITATLEHPKFIDLGHIEVTFPIDDARLAEELKSIGHVEIIPHSHILSVQSEAASLCCLEDRIINLDELNYLAKRLDSFDKTEMAKFNGAVYSEKITDMRDLINLTFNLHNYTVATDFTDFKRLGTQHTLALNGGGMAQSELDKIDAYAVGRELLESGKGVVTPYGVVFDNGLDVEQLYDGKHFPSYYYSADDVMVVSVYKKGENIATPNREWLYLPCPIESIQKALCRLGVDDCSAVDVKYEDSNFLHDEFYRLLEDNENITHLNGMCRAIADNCEAWSEKLVAIMEYSGARTALEVTGIALSYDKFIFSPGLKPSDSGFTSLGFVQCNDSLDEILSYGIDEPQGGMTMGGM